GHRVAISYVLRICCRVRSQYQKKQVRRSRKSVWSRAFIGKPEKRSQRRKPVMRNASDVAFTICPLAGMAFAQSSGNFSYATTGDNFVGCTLNTNGAIQGGFQCQQSCTLNPDGTSSCTSASGQCMGNAVAGIKTSSGNGNVFV